MENNKDFNFTSFLTCCACMNPEPDEVVIIRPPQRYDEPIIVDKANNDSATNIDQSNTTIAAKQGNNKQENVNVLIPN